MLLRRALVPFALACLIAAACSSDPETVSTDTTEPSETPSGWVSHDLGPIAADTGTLSVALDDGALAVLTVEEPATIHGWRLTAEGVEEVPVEAAAAPEFRILRSIARGPEGLVAFGTSHPGSRTFVLRSEDGSSWEEVDAAGFETPVDVTDVLSTDIGYVAVGAARTADDPDRGGFQPVVLTSENGIAWTTADLPPVDGEGSLQDIAAVDDELLAVGHTSGNPSAWRSTDAGASWVTAETPPISRAAGSGIVADGGTLHAVAGGFEGSPTTVSRSTDGGRTWQDVSADLPPLSGRGPMTASEHGYLIAGTGPVRARAERPRDCYIDIEWCERGPGEQDLLLRSDDAASWTPVDISGIDETFEGHVIRTSTAGDIILIGADGSGHWAAWVWPADAGPLRRGERQAVAELEGDYEGPPLLDYEDPLEVGETYAFPVGGHCGADFLGVFDGSTWFFTDSDFEAMPNPGRNEMPDNWPATGRRIYGYLNVVAADTIEYSTDPEGANVIATYERSDEDPALCG